MTVRELVQKLLCESPNLDTEVYIDSKASELSTNEIIEIKPYQNATFIMVGKLEKF